MEFFKGLYVLVSLLYFSAHVAKQLAEDSFGLIFGINTFIAVFFQSVLTFTVVSNVGGFALDIRGQFVTYGSYFIMLAFIYTVVAIMQLTVKKRRSSN